VLSSRSEVVSSLSDTQQSFRSETDSNISVVTRNDPGEPVKIYQSQTENHQYEKLININFYKLSNDIK
jgi:hypothetical protein